MAEVRPVTGSVILCYDPGGDRDGRPCPSGGVGLAALRSPCRKEGLAGRARSLPRGRGSPLFVVGRLLWLGAVTAAFVFSLAQRLLLNPAFSPGIFSIVGMAVCVLGVVPLVRRADRGVRERRDDRPLPLSRGHVPLRLFAGEIVTALEVIWVTDLVCSSRITWPTGLAGKSGRPAGHRSGMPSSFGTAGRSRYLRRDSGSATWCRSGRPSGLLSTGPSLRGEALVDEAHITGRAEGVLKNEGDWVYAGTIVEEGSLVVRAERVGEDTYSDRMMRLVEASLAKARPGGEAGGRSREKAHRSRGPGRGRRHSSVTRAVLKGPDGHARRRLSVRDGARRGDRGHGGDRERGPQADPGQGRSLSRKDRRGRRLLLRQDRDDYDGHPRRSPR